MEKQNLSYLSENVFLQAMVSIIIPTYNRAGLIKYTLDSLQAARHPGVALEVIVVDDGSTDNTVDFVTSNNPHVKVLRNKGKGAAAARNTGLAAATGRYVMYLDSDDLVGENYFAAKIAHLEKYNDCDAVYGKYDFFASEGAFNEQQIVFRHKYPVYSGGTQHAKDHLVNYLGGNFLPQNSIIWRKGFLQKINGHDEGMAVNQDVELVVRSIFNGLQLVAVTDDTRVFVRNHSVDNRVGDPKNAVEKWRQILKLRKKIFADLKTYSFDREDCLIALSTYLFSYWKMLRHTEPAIAKEYLEFAKQVYWPVPIKGGLGYRLLAKILGPVGATEMKYSLLKRD